MKIIYILAMVSVAAVDLLMNGVYFVLSGSPQQMLVLIPENALALGIVNALVASRIYRPIERFTQGQGNHAAARKALQSLPFRSALWVMILTFAYCTWIFSIGTFTPENVLLDQIPDLKLALAVAWFGLVYSLLYGFYTYFVISDLSISMRARLSRSRDLGIEPHKHRLRPRLVFTFSVLALLPSSHMLLDLLVFSDLRLAQGFDVLETVLLNLIATFLVLGIALVFVARTLLRPIRELTETVNRIGQGRLESRAVVLSDDEMGVLAKAVNGMMEGLQERAFIRETFGHYVPESVASDIIAGKAPIEPKIETASILFADIEGFTGLAERLSPAELVEVLNEYFSAVIEPVQRHNGVVNQFQGDGMLVTFNVPVRDPRHADNAVTTALEILETVNSRYFGGIRLRTRIGINTGLVFAGNVGSGDRYNYTVHGDAVNVASRLEALNKDLDTQLLVSSATMESLNDHYPLSKLRSVGIKGKGRPVSVFTLVQGNPSLDDTNATDRPLAVPGN